MTENKENKPKDEKKPYAYMRMRFTDTGNLVVSFKPSREEFIAQNLEKATSSKEIYRTVRLENEDGDLILRFPHIPG